MQATRHSVFERLVPSRVALLVLLASLTGIGTANAQGFPSKPVRIVIGFAAGGSLDINARQVAQRVSAQIGQPMLVENRPGAAGQIAMQYVSAAAPDGYTLILLSAGTTIASARPNPPFDVRRDVIPVAGMAAGPLAIYVNAASASKTLQQFIRSAAARPGALNYASTGVGSLQNLLFEFLKQRSGVDIVHVPYKGSPESTTGVIGGQVDVGMDTLVAVKPHMDSGKVRVLALTSASGAGGLPGMSDSGVSGFDFVSWSIFAAPPKTSSGTITYLNNAFNAVYRDPEVKAYFAQNGQTVLDGEPERFSRLLAQEVEQWSRVIQTARIQFN